MQSYLVTGEAGFQYAVIASGASPVGGATQRITVAAGAPALYAAITDPNGVQPSPTSCQMTITAPDGTVYNQNANTTNIFAAISGGQLYVLCVLNPMAGLWSLNVRCTVSQVYSAVLATAPSNSPFTSAMAALAPYFPDAAGLTYEELAYYLTQWAFWPCAACLSAAVHQSGIQMNLANLMGLVLDVDAITAGRMLSQMSGLNVLGTSTVICQGTGNAPPEVERDTISNGDASKGLTGWTILANGGAGWSTQSGYATQIEYDSNFAVSTGWCKKCQEIDLVLGAGFPASYLDLCPVIEAWDWVAANYPNGATPSQYYLLVQLRDAQHNPVKTFQTGMMSIPATVEQDGTLDWTKIRVTFSNYGPGIRYLYFEHGGVNSDAWTSAQYGLKMTGSSGPVQVGEPHFTPKELLVNGSAQQGMTGWTPISTNGNPWVVESGPAAECPGSIGNTDFGVTGGWGKKYQVVDLVAAGYTTDFLIASPLIQASMWICSYPTCTCRYYTKVVLQDASKQTLFNYDSGIVSVPSSPGVFTPFIRLVNNISNYPSGVRYLYFEHGAMHDMNEPGVPAAKLTGNSLRIMVEPYDNQSAMAASSSRAFAKPALGASGTRVNDTTVVPFRWVCFVWTTHAGGPRYLGSGWLAGGSRNYLVLLTAAHNLYQRDKGGWATSIRISPAQGGGGNPYTTYTASLADIQIAFNYFMKDQGQANSSNSHDYAAIVLRKASVDWDTQGFTPLSETDAQLRNQAGMITGYPGNYNKGKNPQDYGMYQESVTLAPNGDTEVAVPTDFTEGASGGPVYVAGTNNAVGIYSHGSWGGWGTTYARRIAQDLLEDSSNWSSPLEEDDLITSLKMIIRTGTDNGAGTDDDIVCNIDGNGYDLDAFWIGGNSGLFRSRNEEGDFDAYDLTQPFLSHYPNGIHLSDLIGKTYVIKRNPSVIMYHSLFTGDWEVENISVYVNNRLLCVGIFNAWVHYGIEGSDTLVGTFHL